MLTPHYWPLAKVARAVRSSTCLRDADGSRSSCARARGLRREAEHDRCGWPSLQTGGRLERSPSVKDAPAPWHWSARASPSTRPGPSIPASFRLLLLAEARARRRGRCVRRWRLGDALAGAVRRRSFGLRPSCASRRGPLLLNSRGLAGEAEASLLAALELARPARAAVSGSFAPLTSLARLWADRGEHGEGPGLLAPVYGWSAEGFDTAGFDRSGNAARYARLSRAQLAGSIPPNSPKKNREGECQPKRSHIGALTFRGIDSGEE